MRAHNKIKKNMIKTLSCFWSVKLNKSTKSVIFALSFFPINDIMTWFYFAAWPFYAPVNSNKCYNFELKFLVVAPKMANQFRGYFSAAFCVCKR